MTEYIIRKIEKIKTTFDRFEAFYKLKNFKYYFFNHVDLPIDNEDQLNLFLQMFDMRKDIIGSPYKLKYTKYTAKTKNYQLNFFIFENNDFTYPIHIRLFDMATGMVSMNHAYHYSLKLNKSDFEDMTNKLFKMHKILEEDYEQTTS